MSVAEHREQPADFDPIERFAESVMRRQTELAELQASFAHGLEVVADLEQVNQVLAASSRPDLVITAPVDFPSPESPDNMGNIENFDYRMRGFGIRDHSQSGRYAAYRPFTTEERAEFFALGARGNGQSYMQFAQAHGLDEQDTLGLIGESHIAKPAFMRMWVVLPELTEYLMTQCLNQDSMQRKPIQEELFVAYTLMAQLIDRKDPSVQYDSGEVNYSYLSL